MWLLTAVGPIHGQRHFTFVLEKSKSYKIGRDQASEICFQVRTVRQKEGTLEVGDWSPTDHTTPPSVVWKPDYKKNTNIHISSQVMSPIGTVGSTDLDEYAVDTRENQAEVALDSGSGLKLTADVWFTVRWQQLHISYDKMKNEEEDFTAGLRKCCISWTASFQPTDPAEVVISGAYKSSQDCYFAVCYGLPIVSEQWLYMVGNRLRACWKKVADSEDSFLLPDPLDERFRPPLDPSLRNASASLAFWVPRSENRTLFAGWRVLGLKSTKALLDKRYYVAMGAEWDEMEILNPLPLSSSDFLDRITPNIQAAEQAGQKLIVMYLPSVKKDLQDRSVNFESVITGACETARGVTLASGAILWRSVVAGSVQRIIDQARPGEDAPGATAAPTSSAVTTTIIPPSSAVQPPTEPPSSAVPNPTGRLTRRAGTTSRAASRAPSAPPTAQPDAIPSTFPEDNETAAAAKAPKKDAPKKPLKRRAGREAKADNFDDIEMAEPTQPSILFHVPESLDSGGPSQPPGSLQSRIPDSMMDLDSVQPSAPPPTRAAGKLKRRAGVGATQSSFLNDIDTSVAYAEKAQKEDRKVKQRELYEELNRETMSGPSAFKRARTMDPETQLPESNRAELMQVDEENDFVSRALRSARGVKREGVSPVKGGKGSNKSSKQTSPVKSPAKQPAPIEEEEEGEEEEPEPQLQVKKPAKKGAKDVQQPGTQLDKDEKFLQAITKNTRKKAEIDELDKEFNQLRIPKPNTKAKAKATWEAPDYSVLQDFDDEMRGNFIEIVKKDLFRKDVRKDATVVVDNGRPNFKKFKKKNIVRRDPVSLVLSAQHAQAEMGEPYWQMEVANTQPKKTQGRSQATQSQMRRGTAMPLADDFEDDLPLVPAGKRKLLTQIPEDNDDDIIPMMPPATRRRGATPMAQTQTAPARRSRAASAVSEASSADASAAAAAAPATRRTATQRPRRGGTQAKPLLIDDSDDDNLFATAPSATTRSSRARGAAAAGPSAKTSTLAAEPETLSRPVRSTQAAGSSLRRRLLVDDDDDETEFKGVQKKRRLR